MAKALYAQPTASDPRLLAEVTRLRARVVELEAEVARLRALQLPPLDDVDIDPDLLVLAQAGREPALA